MPVEYSEDQIKNIVSSNLKKSTVNRDIAERRENWSLTKKLIIDCLEAIKKRVNLTDTMNFVSGREVQFSFGKINSGLPQNEGEDVKMLTKVGGSLIYRQMYNGKVIVLIGLPYIERYRPNQDLVQIEILPPKEITQQKVADHFEVFLEKIIDWEEADE